MVFSDDEYYMRVALSHARRGLGHAAPNPAVGCVIVRDGVIVAAAHTAPGGRPHAEALALKMAGGAACGAAAYVTLEPCAHYGQTGPCALALAEAGISRVVVACVDPDPRVSGRGLAMLEDAGIEVACGVLEAEALALNKGFILKNTRGRPLVTLKLAVSADGKITAQAGTRTRISGAAASRYVHLLRSQHDSILIGVGTALVDNSILTTRLEGHNHVMKRVILDERLDLPLESALVQSAENAPVMIVCQNAPVDKAVEMKARGCELIEADPHDLTAVLRLLAGGGITRLLVEGGGRVAGSFLSAGLVDELQVIRSPSVLGAQGVEAFGGGGPEGYGLVLQKTRRLGDDLLEIYRPAD